MSEKRTGCRYCDGWMGVQHPAEEPGFLVCNICGAEWSGCKIEYEVSDRDLEYERKEMEEYQKELDGWE